MDIIKLLTKRIRAAKAKKFIEDNNDRRLLDLGCGDKSFVKSFKNLYAIGLDKKYGQNIEEKLSYKDNYFDYITMLAVIEHLNNPSKVIKEGYRVLKEDGLLIITTPYKRAERFIKLYCCNNLDHKRYFTKKDFENFNGFDLIHYSTFEFGLNQLIVLKKENNYSLIE